MQDLRHLMAAYFHQDWDDEYDGSWGAAVDDYVRRSPDRAPGLADDIRHLLNTDKTDADLDRTLADLGNYWIPGTSPTAYRDWLIAIRSRVTPG